MLVDRTSVQLWHRIQSSSTFNRSHLTPTSYSPRPDFRHDTVADCSALVQPGRTWFPTLPYSVLRPLYSRREPHVPYLPYTAAPVRLMAILDLAPSAIVAAILLPFAPLSFSSRGPVFAPALIASWQGRVSASTLSASTDDAG